MANEANDTLRLTFEISNGDAPVRREEISAESVTIGRGPAAMLRIEDDAMADLHAVVNIQEDGGVQILDLGSATGSKVNGESVEGNTALNSGDTITIGPVTLVVTIANLSGSIDETPHTPIGVASGEDEEEIERTDQVPEGATQAPDANDSIVDHGEDVMAFIMRSGTATSDAGVDRSKGKVLEVAEIWADTVMDVKHYASGAKVVPVGSSTGYKWRFVGMPISWVPPGFAKIAWLLAPTLSEASEERKNDFYVPPEDLPEEDFALFEGAGGSYIFNMSDKWSGFVDIGDQRHTFQELIESGKASANGAGLYQVPVTDDTRVVADLGHVIFFSQMVAPGKRIIAKGNEERDFVFSGLLAFMTFLLLMVGVIWWQSPGPSESEVLEVPDRFVELLLQQPEPEPQKEKNKPDANPDAGEGVLLSTRTAEEP
jgi:pSer/pThr/pTyr-binding forkhead associated (FHA) protein